MTKTYYQNPKVDYLFGLIGGKPIPTKQDKFKPIDVVEIDEQGNEKALKMFYVQKPDKEAMIEFHRAIQNVAKPYFANNAIIKKPQHIEVILGISAPKSRFNEVDLDNLAKAILDGLIGVAYEDDAQITSLICNKYISEHNGIIIAITRLTDTRKGFGGDIKTIKSTPWK